AGRRLRPGLPAAARGRARRPDGATAEDPEAEAPPRSGARAAPGRGPLSRGRAPGMAERLLLRCRDIPDLRRLEVTVAHGGYAATRKALTTRSPEQLDVIATTANVPGR